MGRRIGEILCAIVLGIAIAWGVSSAARYSLEEPEMRNCGTDRPLFFRPLPEVQARSIGEACHARIDREIVIRRFERAHSVPVVAIARVVAFLVDPINLVLTVCCTVVILVAWRRYRDRRIVHTS